MASKDLGYVNHQQNTSTAKAAFSFPKQQRFSTPQQRRNINDLMYLPPVDLHSTKSISFGYGNKVDLARGTDAPSPDKYLLRGDFEINSGSLRKGFTFGIGREKTAFGDPLLITKRRLPGVGAYTLDAKVFNKTNGGYIGTKLGSCIGNDKHIGELPGPGTYDTSAIEIHNSGKYVLSKFKNPQHSNYRFKTEHTVESRVKDSLKHSKLGPGAYRQVDTFNPEGTYQVSTHESRKGYSFSKSHRRSITEGREMTPAPGMYNKFSVFGGDQ